MAQYIRYLFSGEEVPSWIAGLDEEYPRSPLEAPPPLAAENRRSTIAAAVFVLALGGADEALPNAGGLRLQELLGPAPIVVIEPPVVGVFAEGDELPPGPTLGVDDEPGPAPVVIYEPPVASVVTDEDQLPNAGGLRLDDGDVGPPFLVIEEAAVLLLFVGDEEFLFAPGEEPPGPAPVVTLEPPVVYVITDEDELPNAGGLRLEDEAGPTLAVPASDLAVVQVYADEDALPVAAAVVGLEEEGGPLLPYPQAEQPGARVFTDSDELPNAGGLRLEEDTGPAPVVIESPPVVGVFAAEDELPNAGGLRLEEDIGPPPVVLERPPVVSIFAEGDELAGSLDEEAGPILSAPSSETPFAKVFTDDEGLPAPIAFTIGEEDGPILPDPQIAPLVLYSVAVTGWEDSYPIPLGFVSVEDLVLTPPTLSGVTLVAPTLTSVTIIPD